MLPTALCVCGGIEFYFDGLLKLPNSMPQSVICETSDDSYTVTKLKSTKSTNKISLLCNKNYVNLCSCLCASVCMFVCLCLIASIYLCLSIRLFFDYVCVTSLCFFICVSYLDISYIVTTDANCSMFLSSRIF